MSDQMFVEDDRYIVSTARGSAQLLAALWREHPVTMRTRFILGKASRSIECQPEPKPVLQSISPRSVPLIASSLIDSVAADFDISYGELIGEGRELVYVDARAVVVRILRMRGWSFPKIGRALGDRDHSTVMNTHCKYGIYEARNPLVAMSFARHAALGVHQAHLPRLMGAA